MQSIKLKDAPLGEFVKRKPDAKGVYTRGEFDRTTKRYTLIDEMDISREVYLKGETIVYIGFDY